MCQRGVQMIELLADKVMGSLDPMVFPILSPKISKLVMWVKN